MRQKIERQKIFEEERKNSTVYGGEGLNALSMSDSSCGANGKRVLICICAAFQYSEENLKRTRSGVPL